MLKISKIDKWIIKKALSQIHKKIRTNENNGIELW
jgi:hypothetical protein